MKCNLKLTFEFEEHNGYINLSVIAGKRLISVTPKDGTITVRIDMPETVQFVTTGKDMNSDTSISENGEILKDKHVLLKGIKIDHIDVPASILSGIKMITDSGDEILGSYFGANGIAMFNLTKKDAILQQILYRNSND